MTEPKRQTRKPGLEHFVRAVGELPTYNPRELDALLVGKGYRGQEEARRAMCLMAYRHVARIRRIHLDGIPREELPQKSNYLLAGPTGCGKTFLIETLFGEILNVPTAVVDVTSLSETGYVGQDPATILTRLVHKANDNLMLASIGIVCLDEFDKISSGQNNAVFAGAGTTKDVTGMGVQRELLKMLEASEVVVPMEYNHSSYGENAVLQTDDIAFVAAGAFSGISNIAAKSEGDIGFGRSANLVTNDGDAIAVDFRRLDLDNLRHFQSYGFLPELIARFTRVLPFAALEEDILVDILRDEVTHRMRREFELEGIELEVSDEVYRYLAQEALRRESGARGLRPSLLRHLEEAAFESFGAPGVEKLSLGMKSGEVCVSLKRTSNGSH